ncbi:hypothetical protein DL770_011181 [Monosporascus sp. CRB-9-2]|nr:hypothetical protein DL770_011181 [Monosporascus sp. CRB-9-2]
MKGGSAHVVGIAARETVGQRQHGVFGFRCVAVVQGKRNALALQHHAGELRRQLREFCAQLALQLRECICVSVQADEAAVCIAAFGAVHTGDDEAGQRQARLHVMHRAPADDRQRAPAGGMQRGQCFAQRRRNMHRFGLRRDIDEGAVKVEQEGRSAQVERGQGRRVGRRLGRDVLGQTGSGECA